MKLTIQEIADLKEGRKSLEEISKTHDGTSMGTITPILDELCKNKGTSEKVIAFDENGKKVYELNDDKPTNQGGSIGVLNIERDISSIKGEKKNLHCVVNENESLSNRTAVDINLSGGQLNIPDYNQLKSLLSTNEDGEYLLRSYTMISDNKTRMTFIKNNDFNKSNHKEYRQICKDIIKDSKKYKKELSKIVEEKAEKIRENWTNTQLHGDYVESWESSQILKQARKEALNDYGSWEQKVMKDNGYDKQLEECNVKFRMSYKYEDN